MENSLILRQDTLPDTPQELAKFVLLGREKLIAVRAEIRAINKAQLAKDVYDQKLEEAQMLGEAVLDAEVKLGEMTSPIPKASGVRSDLQKSAIEPRSTGGTRLENGADEPLDTAVHTLPQTKPEVI